MSLRQELLAVLRDADEPLTVRHLAAAVGRPPTTVRFHLDRLQRDGAVAARPVGQAGPGRPRLGYTARRTSADRDDGSEYRLLAGALAEALADHPDGPGRALAAGVALGSARANPDAEPLDDLVDVLTDAGFAPVAEADRIRLCRCPFLEAARAQPAITCSVHRGLMQGVLDAPRTGDAPARQVTALEAFVDGDQCLATIGTAGGQR